MDIRADEISKIIRDQIGSFTATVDDDGRSVDHRRRRHAHRQHGVRRQHRFAVSKAEREIVSVGRVLWTRQIGRQIDRQRHIWTSERTKSPKSFATRSAASPRPLTTTVDPSIIGGVVTRIGSTVYDGSIASQLAKLREKLSA